MRNKKGLFTLAIAAVIGFFYAFTPAAPQDVQIERQPGPRWSNLKVLPQDISKDSLMDLMEGFTISLGVDCGFCHSPREKDPTKLDFADDSKIEKLIARGMIEMTDEINSKYFLPHSPDPEATQVFDVSCMTCHRGNKNPKAFLEGVQKAIHIPEGKK